jgi:hypothetical protein
MGYRDIVLLTTLKSLFMSGTGFDNDHAKLLKCLTKLTQISLKYTGMTLKNLVSALVAMSSSCQLSNISYASDTPFDVPDSLRILTGLRKLALASVTFPPPSLTTSENPLVDLTNLVSLTLEGWFGDYLVPAVLIRMVKLKTLVLESRTQLSLQAAKSLIEAFPDLRQFKVAIRGADDVRTLQAFAREKYPLLHLNASPLSSTKL